MCSLGLAIINTGGSQDTVAKMIASIWDNTCSNLTDNIIISEMSLFEAIPTTAQGPPGGPFALGELIVPYFNGQEVVPGGISFQWGESDDPNRKIREYDSDLSSTTRTNKGSSCNCGFSTAECLPDHANDGSFCCGCEFKCAGGN